jgi:hypothetical protein
MTNEGNMAERKQTLSRGLRRVIQFQKTLALAASASNSFEAEAAEQAARRLMENHNIDPMCIPDFSFVSQVDFADLLKKLREEWRAAHPDYYYGKPDKNGSARRLRRKPRPKRPKPNDKDLDVSKLQGLFDDFDPGDRD